MSVKTTEGDFARKLQLRLESSLPHYRITVGESLLYRLMKDGQGRTLPEGDEPRRGQFAFQTDVLVKTRRHSTPLVAIELKYGHFTTHDVLTYSTKALKHKEVYPYLRYGLVIGDYARLDRKFFIHNVGFDFAYSMSGNQATALRELILVIRRQIKAAKKIMAVFDHESVTRYESQVRIS